MIDLNVKPSTPGEIFQKGDAPVMLLPYLKSLYLDYAPLLAVLYYIKQKKETIKVNGGIVVYSDVKGMYRRVYDGDDISEDILELKEAKRKALCFTAHACFDPKKKHGSYTTARNIENIHALTGLFFIDIDLDKENIPSSIETAVNMYEYFTTSEDPHVAALRKSIVLCKVSMSLCGLHILVRYNELTKQYILRSSDMQIAFAYYHSQICKAVDVLLKKKTWSSKYTVDPTMKDLMRICFLSNSEYFYLNLNSSSLKFLGKPPEKKQIPLKNKTKKEKTEEVERLIAQVEELVPFEEYMSCLLNVPYNPTKTFEAHCPYHPDKNPSLYYNPTKGHTFKCYSSTCGKVGHLSKLIQDWPPGDFKQK